MAHLGKQIARDLLDDQPGTGEGSEGWRGALQAAADLTRNHPDVLRLADEIHAAARNLRAAAAVRAYAMSTSGLVPNGPGHWLLTGMLEQFDRVN